MFRKTLKVVMFLFCSFLLVGCITTGGQRVPVTGGGEINITTPDGGKYKINVSGKTAVKVLADGSIEAVSQDDFGDLIKTYMGMRGQ